MDDQFADFAASHLSRLLGFGYVLTGTHHDAWDLTQEALARVGVRWRKGLVPDAPLAYTRQAMVRLNIDRIRLVRREVLTGTSGPDTSSPAVWDDADPRTEWLVDALRKLTPRQRTALALRFVEDLDVKSIAARMGCSTGTAKSHLSRGLAHLRTVASEMTVKEDTT